MTNLPTTTTAKNRNRVIIESNAGFRSSQIDVYEILICHLKTKIVNVRDRFSMFGMHCGICI